MSGCGEGAEWVEQLRAPHLEHCTSQSQPVKATLIRRAVTPFATIPRRLRRQNGPIWYYLVHDDFFVSGLDWGTIIIIKQNKVPQGWTDATVGDFASVQTGPFGSQLHNEDYVESGTPIITVEHMDGKYIAHRNLPLVSQNDVDRLRKYDLHTGDIVFSRVGSVDRAVMVSQHEDGWLFSGRCLRVRPYDPNTGSYFLWWFNQPVIRQLVTASAVGATMPSINTSILNSIRIVFPQKDIVTQFCKMADGLIEIIATNLEEIRKLNDAREYIQLSLSR